METIQSWFLAKLAAPAGRLKAPAQATEQWERFTGRRHFAKVSLVALPDKDFSFYSADHAWPNEASKAEFERYVLDGIVSELLLGPGPSVLGLRIELQAAEVHEVDSNGNSFYMAAKRATEKLLYGANDHYRGNCSYSEA